MQKRLSCQFIVSLWLCVFGQTAHPGSATGPVVVPLSLTPQTATENLPNDLDLGPGAVAFNLILPGKTEATINASEIAWINIDALEFELFASNDAPRDIQALLYWIDADNNWFQNLAPSSLTPGKAVRLKFDISASADGWAPQEHFGAWHHRVRMRPAGIGLRLFSGNSYSGTVAVAEAVAVSKPKPPHSPPAFNQIRVLTPTVNVYERYELAVDLPDRYDNPFDPAEISLAAIITDPNGSIDKVFGFYHQSYFRHRGDAGDRLVPQGAPHWRIRYTPTTPGAHRIVIEARDRLGTVESDAFAFQALPPRRPGFVRVSSLDPRFLEFDDGSPYFPIGHNIRSPFDDRVNRQFPWAIRHPETSVAYRRYFRDMQAHGENITEVWMASWSLGLEWSRTAPGYHGLGQYNLIHAWELDHVIEEAERRGIYINLTIHNHGQFSTHWDPEWSQNPYNRSIGGYLDSPEEYFSDERAMEDFMRRMRYIIARWGYSPHVFAWKLWNELDLTGAQRERVNYRRPEVVEWHRQAGRRIKDLDPYRHLIGTHFCGDFTHQNPDIVKLPEIDIALVDAYHGNPDPLHIVELMRRTAEFNNRFEKPVLITEFGGSAYAGTLEHIESALQAGLWSSVAIPLGGAPMLWWWALIEEQDYYPKFRALANFMDGEDPRNPAATLRRVAVIVHDTNAAPSTSFRAWCFSDGRDGRGWLVDADRFSGGTPPTVSNLALRFDNMHEGAYDIEFWETAAGHPIENTVIESRDGQLTVAVPPFARDLAFKIRALDAGEPRASKP